MHRRCRGTAQSRGQLRAGDSSLTVEVGVQAGRHNSVPRGGPSDSGFVFPFTGSKDKSVKSAPCVSKSAERLLSASLLRLS